MNDEITNETEFIEFDGVDSTTVYYGGMSWLQKIPLEWRNDQEYAERLCFKEAHVLTAGEILEQVWEWCKENTKTYRGFIVTIVCEGPLSGRIYQYGNYSDGTWTCIGQTQGYA